MWGEKPQERVWDQRLGGGGEGCRDSPSGEDVGVLRGGSDKAEKSCGDQREIKEILTRLARAYSLSLWLRFEPHGHRLQLLSPGSQTGSSSRPKVLGVQWFLFLNISQVCLSPLLPTCILTTRSPHYLR